MAVNRSKGMIIGGVVIGIVIIVVAAVSAGMLDGLFSKSPAERAKAAGVVETAEAVRIPLKALYSGKALFLSLESGGRQYYYFALKSRDGAYRAALDACDVCFASNRGYRQEGDLMVCNNCGQTFPSNRVAEIKGGCNPHPLARRVEGQDLVIRKADIFARGEYFARKRS
ncbi:MAG: Fe-S-containing protein [Actinomycetota bacterium]